ncbi:S-layer homology domain-containing protein [Cohnella lubricantis]
MDTQLQFRDAKQIPAGAVGYVAVAVEKGLITGYGDNTFKPNKPVTRAELAALLDRADEQLPDQDAAAVTGTVEAISGTALTVKKPDGTIAALTLDANVFIFRKDAKVAPTALKAGDEVLIRTYQGNVVFIEVTKAAEDAVTVTDAGTVAAFTLNANGKIATISILKTVNGVLSTVLYNVSENVTITGGSGVLSPNANVVVTLTNNAVTSIAILS